MILLDGIASSNDKGKSERNMFLVTILYLNNDFENPY
jgi:hypothetical protein